MTKQYVRKLDLWLDIRESLRLDEVLAELGINILEQRGHELFTNCPLPSHPGKDKNPSFSINEQKLIYSCFACRDERGFSGGNIVHLVMAIQDCDYDEAINWLIPFSDGLAQSDDAFVKQINGYLSREACPPILRNPQLPFFTERKINEFASAAMDIKQWFDSRYIADSVRDALKFGYASSHVRGNYCGPAIIIPHMFKGQWVGYQERWFDSNECAQFGIDSSGRPAKVGKYTNTTDFPKKFTLYGYDRALSVYSETGQPVIAVESAVTVARLISAGYNAVATFGASVTPEQIKLLRIFPEIALAYDNDESGKQALLNLIKSLESYSTVHVISPPEGEKQDLGDLEDAALHAQIDRMEPSFLYETHL